MGKRMSYGITLKVTINPEGEEKKKKAEQELEEFIHRFKDFLKPTFVYDPVKIREFMVERDRILRELDLGFHERMLINRMYLNVRMMQERKRYEILGEDSFYGLWFLS
jgi:hypothetical protein